MDSEITEVVVTNTLPMENRQFSKLTVLSIAPLISEAIYRINHQISVSSLFE
jgi:ribose-phosphate pyrophosphokinase